MKRCLGVSVAILAMFGAFLLTASAASAAKKRDKPLVVCEFGCKYKTIQEAVDESGKNATIKVKPGKYKEGVIVDGHGHDGLTIRGTAKNPKKVVLEGKNAKSPDGLAQNGIEGVDVNDLTIKNMWARNYASNGFFVRDSRSSAKGKSDCNDYLMKNLIASFNRAYGLYAFECVGGRMTKSTAYGHGDSAFYIGAVPVQKKPKTITLDHLNAYENVIGYSGTNSRYVDIHDSNFFNNGIGVVPNTLDSEPFEPSADGEIHDNNIFWNNFNHYLPNSRVESTSRGLGTIGDPPNELTIQFPTGVGITLLGSDGWKVYDNNIFGHFKWGAAAVSNPFNEGDDAISRNNQFLNNTMGAGGTDTNAIDFFVDGSGSGNCFSGNASSTFDSSPGATDAELYPPCPAPMAPTPGASNTSGAEGVQLFDLAGYVTNDPPQNQQCAWTPHAHPPFMGFKPLAVTPGPNCP